MWPDCSKMIYQFIRLFQKFDNTCFGMEVKACFQEHGQVLYCLALRFTRLVSKGCQWMCVTHNEKWHCSFWALHALCKAAYQLHHWLIWPGVLQECGHHAEQESHIVGLVRGGGRLWKGHKMSLFERVSPSIRPCFLSQKIDVNEPKKNMLWPV